MILLMLGCNGPEDSGVEPVDTGDSCTPQAWYLDEDGDGLGAGGQEAAVSAYACEPPEAQGFATTWGDCYDYSAGVGAEGIFLIDADEVQDLAEATSLDSPHVLVVEKPSTLVVCDGTWALSVQASASLVATGQSLDSVLTGLDQARPFTMQGADLTLMGLTVRDGVAENGGAVWTDASLYLTDGRIIESEATLSGGGIYQTGADGVVTVIGGAINNNTAGDDGGGLYVEGSLVLEGGTLSQNVAVDGGGGAYLAGLGTSSVLDSEVSYNSADRGGGLDLRPPHQVTVQDSELTYNIASFGGGFATWETGRLDCVNSGISNNTGDTKGGGGWLLPSDEATALTSAGCTWSDNTRTDVHNTQTSYTATDGEWECVGTRCDLEEVD